MKARLLPALFLLILSCPSHALVDMNNAVTRILEKMTADKKNSSYSADYWAQLKVKLSKDQSLRESYAAQYALVNPVKEGAKLMANGRELENIVLQKQVYTRTLADG